MKQILALAVFLSLVVPLGAVAAPEASHSVPSGSTSQLPTCTNPDPIGNGVGQSVNVDVENAPPIDSHCDLVFEFCSGWLWGGECCSSGKKKLFNECVRYWKCGLNPVTKDTLTTYSCSSTSCPQ